MRLYVSLFVVLGLLTGACKKINQNKVERNLVKGSWKIAEWVEDTVEQTDLVADWQFNFTKDQMVVASQDTLEQKGQWSLTEADREVHLKVDFDSLQPLNTFNEPWIIVHEQKTALELKRPQDRLFLEKL